MQVNTCLLKTEGCCGVVFLFKGRIYKISSIRPDVSQVYIGQTIRNTLQMRWNGHKRDAERFLNKKRSKNNQGKAVKLHMAINNNGADAMLIEELEFYQYEDKNELLNKLDERENHFIDMFNSITEGVGWNKAYASKIKRPLGQDTKETWEIIANKHGVDVRKLMHQVNQNQLNIEEALERIKELDKKPIRQYSYGMQTHDFIRELLPYDKNNIGEKNIEARIRTLRKSKKLRVDLDKENNKETIFLIDRIFDPISSREEIEVNTPKGKIRGKKIKEIWKKLLPIFPDNVPEYYSTVQNRLNGARFQVKWSHDQAFGFRYPPDFEEVEELIEKKGYRWGEIDGVQKVPSFKNEYKTKTNPIILHSISTVYFKEQDWCDAYKLTDRKKIKELRDAGKTNEEILEYYGKKP